MLDPRIYRTALAAVLMMVIVFAFSLENEPGGLHTALAPQAFNGGAAFATMNALAKRAANAQPGSAQDDNVAGAIDRGLKSAGLAPTTEYSQISTVDGSRTVETVTAVNPGLSAGTIVVVAPRDLGSGSPKADMSASAALVQLAAVIHEQSLKHSIMFVSTSGTVGGDGIAQLAHQLTSQPVVAAIVLGDLAARDPSQPIIVPWSNGDTLAPAALRNTLASAIGRRALVGSRNSGIPAQLARLAFPMTISAQGPLLGAGLPAVLVSLSGERGPRPGEAIAPTPARLGGMGQALLQAIDALDAAQPLPPPSSYLVLSSKVVPFWAVRLLVLALLLPVIAVTVDGLARARRRGHTITRWAGWVLAGAVPFILGVLVIKAAKYTSVIGVAPPAPVGAGVIPLDGSGLVVLIAVALVIVASFAFVRPAIIHVSARLSRETIARGEEPGTGNAGPALLLIASLVALALWWRNPYAAALLVPALHLWVWVVDPEARVPRPVKLLLVIIGLVPPALVIGYYVHAFGLSATGVLWNGALLIAGGQLGLAAALAWSVVLGCLAGAFVIAVVPPGGRGEDAPVVTVRGPVTYAGPGSLGGTQSALRR